MYLSLLPDDGLTPDGVPVPIPLPHSTAGFFAVGPLHIHLQSFPTNPSPGQVLLGHLAAMFICMCVLRGIFSLCHLVK